MNEKVLTEAVIIRLMREAYDQHLQDLMEFDTGPYKGQDSKEAVIDVGLKVRHSKTNLLYTITDLQDDEVTLQKPEGGEFKLSRKELEKEYRLD